jgi:AcrR family transcriptional regulator
VERARTRPNVGGDATRAALVTAAERLFAERGIDAVSLREIGAAAGKRNPNVTQYHFGDRDSLVRAVVRARAGTHHVKREALLDEADGDPEGLARALVEPLADELAGDSHYLGFLFRLLVASDGRLPLATGLDDESTAGFRRLVQQLRGALPDVDPDVVRLRCVLATDFVVMALATRWAAERAGRPVIARRRFVAELVRATAGIFGRCQNL